MSKGQIVETVTSPAVGWPAYFGALMVSLFGDFAGLDSWIKVAALVGAVLLAAAHALTVRNRWLEGEKLKLEIKRAEEQVDAG